MNDNLWESFPQFHVLIILLTQLVTFFDWTERRHCGVKLMIINSVVHWCVFNSFLDVNGALWNTRNRCYDRLLVLGLHMRFVDNEKDMSCLDQLFSRQRLVILGAWEQTDAGQNKCSLRTWWSRLNSSQTLEHFTCGVTEWTNHRILWEKICDFRIILKARLIINPVVNMQASCRY